MATTALRLPDVLASPGDAPAVALLQRYLGPAFGEAGYYTGSSWDDWDTTGSRSSDADRFTADDLVALTQLSVNVPPQAAHALLISDADRFSSALADVAPDADLGSVEEPITNDWPGSRLYFAVVALPGVGQTMTSKLLARKRPRLLPIWDSVIGVVTNTRDEVWEPLRQALRADEGALQTRLVRLHQSAGLAESVTPLRVFDVLCWMEGKDNMTAAGVRAAGPIPSKSGQHAASAAR